MARQHTLTDFDLNRISKMLRWFEHRGEESGVRRKPPRPTSATTVFPVKVKTVSGTDFPFDYTANQIDTALDDVGDELPLFNYAEPEYQDQWKESARKLEIGDIVLAWLETAPEKRFATRGFEIKLTEPCPTP